MINGIFSLTDMIGSPDVIGSSDGKKWFQSVPEPYHHGIGGRIVGAIAVLRGQAYPVRWPVLGEYEAIRLDRLKRPGMLP